MGQLLHGSARTTGATRLSIQRSQKSVKVLAGRYGVSPTTVHKGKKRDFVTDAQMGPKDIRATVLSVEQEATSIAFRRHTLLPLDDCLYALQPSIPTLTRSAMSISTSLKSEPKRANAICSLVSTGLPSSSARTDYIPS